VEDRESHPFLKPLKKKFLVREDTGSPLAIVGDGYKVVHNKEIVDAFEQALDTLPDFKERKVSTYLPFGGSQMYRQYDFNKIFVEPKVGDITQLRLELVNSYDGKLKGGFKISGLRLKCTNGQSIPENFHEISAKHSSKFNLEDIVKSISKALPKFQNIVSTWKNWHEIKMKTQDFVDMLTKSSIPEKTIEKIVDHFAKEDQTKWGAFQASTWVISHDTKSRKDVQNDRVSQLKLESQITSLFYS